MKLLSHPSFRPILAVVLFVSLIEVLKMQWFGKNRGGGGRIAPSPNPAAGAGGEGGAGENDSRPRLVVAHFMLGNTYPFTDKDWEDTFTLAEETSLDALSLNLGPEDWQLTQAQRAYTLLSARNLNASQAKTSHRRKLKLFISLDMNVLPADPAVLVDRVKSIVRSGDSAQLRWDGGVLLSTFGGHQLGDQWRDVISGVERELSEKVIFFPAFFLPPEEILAKDYVHGAFNWNGAWPMGNHTINLNEDQPFLESRKPYMAAVSPLFFTHFGTEGRWAWNKNWIYRSDNLLLPTRFSQLLSLPSHNSPEMIQIISWNDFGESHYISPIMGAQPGSERWTEGMDHEGFRWLVSFFARRWRDGANDREALRQTVRAIEGQGHGGKDGSESLKDEAEGVGVDGVGNGRVLLWYRTQSRDMGRTSDSVVKPDHAEWAQDLLNFFLLLPFSSAEEVYTLQVHNGPKYRPAVTLTGDRDSASNPKFDRRSRLTSRANGANGVISQMLTIPFVPGHVGFEILKDGQVVIAGTGKDIAGEENGDADVWNYNMWSGVYR